jgi:hypothetical protein
MAMGKREDAGLLGGTSEPTQTGESLWRSKRATESADLADDPQSVIKSSSYYLGG